MIIRILGEGQYDVADHALDRLNELDSTLESAVEAGDEAAFQGHLSKMVELVQSRGERLGEDELLESEAIVPPPDSTIDEVGEHFDGEGLIPG